MPDDRERAGLGRRSADAHDDAPDDQDRRRRGERRDEAAAAEERNPAEQELLPSEDVTERPTGQHQGGEREHVAVDDPLQARDAGLQRRLHVRERDADDRVVEEREEEDEADGREREALCDGRPPLRRCRHLTIGAVAAVSTDCVVAPAAFAVTSTTIVCPASAATGLYEVPVALAITVQRRAFVLQRSHE